MTKLGVVTGLMSEARVAAKQAANMPDAERAFVACAGIGYERAKAAAAQAAENGITHLVSLGLAGGIAPGRRPGSLILATWVTNGSVAIETDTAWRQQTHNNLRGRMDIATGPIAHVNTPLLDRREKAEAYFETGAQAVDMESFAIGEVAQANGLPFLVARVVVDSARDNVPNVAAQAVTEDGRSSVLTALSGLLLAPWELPALIGMARAHSRAMRSLRRVCAHRFAALLD